MVVLLRQSRAEPADLPAMIDLVFRHMEPSPMRVDSGRHVNRGIQPRIIAIGKEFERVLSDGGQLVNVVLQRKSAQRVSAVRPQGEGSRQASVLLWRE